VFSDLSVDPDETQGLLVADVPSWECRLFSEVEVCDSLCVPDLRTFVKYLQKCPGHHTSNRSAQG
jgi:hypothetical protein